MKVILTENINNVGKIGDVLTVSDGYARNFLLPKKLAVMATPQNLKKVESIRKDAELVKVQKHEALKVLAAQAAAAKITFTRKADEEGHLFGSVSEIDIANEFAKLGIAVNKTHIVMEKQLKAIGTFAVNLHFGADINSQVNVIINNDNIE